MDLANVETFSNQFTGRFSSKCRKKLSKDSSEVTFVAKLKGAYLNLERYTPDDIRSLLSDAINALRTGEHLQMKKNNWSVLFLNSAPLNLIDADFKIVDTAVLPKMKHDRGSKMARSFAYVRVSTVGQTVKNEIQEIDAAGFKVEPRRIISEIVSSRYSTW